jgi:hypothetical protein
MMASLGTARGFRAVELSLDDGGSWLPLGARSLPVMNGTRVRSTGGAATLELTDGSRIVLLPFSAIRVREAGSATAVAVDYGRLTFRLPSQTRVELQTPSARLEPIRAEAMGGELLVRRNGTTGLEMTAGRLRIHEAVTGQVRVASVATSGQGLAKPLAASAGTRGVFGPQGESLGYLAPDGRLVAQPGFTSDLTQPFPSRLVQAAMAKVPAAAQRDALPLFDLNGGYVGYVAGPEFHAQAVGVTPGGGSAEAVIARAPADLTPRVQPVTRPLAKGDRLSDGDKIRTGRDGAAELRLGDGSLIRLGQLSDFEVERLENDSAGAPRTSKLRLATGKVRAFVKTPFVQKVSTAQGEFSIGTPVATAAVRQTDFAVVQASGGSAKVYTLGSAVETTGVGGGSVTCVSNQYTEVVPGKGPSPCAPIPFVDKVALTSELAFESEAVGAGYGSDIAYVAIPFFVVAALAGVYFSGVFATSIRP